MAEDTRDKGGIRQSPERGPGAPEEGKQEGAPEETKEGTDGEQKKGKGDPSYCFDLDQNLYLYEWLINLVILAISEVKENDKRIWIRKTPYPEMAWEILKETIDEYKANMKMLNPEWTWDELMDYTRKFVLKKTKEGRTEENLS